jgi:hypothetical protein
MSDKICGTGDECEATCPLMRIGRDCPDPLEAIAESLELQTSVLIA